jgi:hypothetical protein
LAVAVTVTVPLPVADWPDVMLSQDVVDEDVHAQPAVVVTLMLALPPELGRLTCSGLTENAQAGGSGVGGTGVGDGGGGAGGWGVGGGGTGGSGVVGGGTGGGGAGLGLTAPAASWRMVTTRPATVIVVDRAGPRFGWIPIVTVDGPVRDEGPCRVSQSPVVATVQGQEASVVTAMVTLSPAAETSSDESDTLNVQGCPGCSSRIATSFRSTSACRTDAVGFGATLMRRVPLP